MSQVDADRNLLFGVLALQDDLIDPRQLADACAVWAVHDDLRLADVLVERGWIAAEDCVQIERRLQRKVAKHGGSANRTLGAEAGPAVRDALRTLDNPHVRTTLNALLPPAGAAAETLVKPAEPRSRYTLSRLHGEGGLGKVWVAFDSDLNREVALKEIRPENAGHPEMWRRFVKEAQVTGQLEHPNIVPVYELGRGPEQQQPFYTMRLVKGRTLSRAIAEYHEARARRAVDPLTLPRLLQVFVNVCQAIAYAHSRGVLHRDLKPENVVLGGFGEVNVLDWGLARLVGRPDADDVPDVTVSVEFQSEVTRVGTQLGTPAYMAPEQAEGRQDLVDERTDVYGLGTILFEMLTGRAPHQGGDTCKLLQQIVAGESPRAREIEPKVPAALDAVCARAMAKARSARYASATQLLDDVQRWLADEPVSVYRDGWSHTLARWGRKHRAATQSLVAGLLVVAAMSSVAAVFVEQARQGEARERAAERRAKQLAEKRLVQIEKANEILTSVFQDLDPRQSEQDGIPLQARLGQRLDRAAELLEDDTVGDPRTVAELQDALGTSQLNLGYPERAIALFTKSSQSLEKLFGPDHADTLNTRSSLALAYRDAGQYDRAIALGEQTLTRMKCALGEECSDTLAAMENLALAYRDAGQNGKAIPLFERALARMRSRLDPGDPRTLDAMNNLATAYRDAARLDRAIPLFEQALRQNEAERPAHPATLVTMNNLALAYRDAGQNEKVIPLIERTLQHIKVKLGPDHPYTLTIMSNLAAAYRDAGQYDRAILLFEQALERTTAKLGLDHPVTLATMSNLAAAYRDNGQVEKGITLFERALEHGQATRPDHPDTLATMDNLAVAYRNTRQFGKATALFEQALDRMKAKLAPGHPQTLVAMNNLATTYQMAGKTGSAIPLFEQAADEMAAGLGPGHPHTLTTLSNLVTAYQAAGRTRETTPTTTGQSKPPLDCSHEPGSAIALAESPEEAKRMERAAALWRTALAYQTRTLPGDHPRRIGTQINLGYCLVLAGKAHEAESLLREVLSCRPQAGTPSWVTDYARSVLGAALLVQQKYAEAEPLLVQGYDGIKRHENEIPAHRRARVADTQRWLARLYEAWDKPEQAAALRDKPPGAAAGGG